MKKSGCRFSVDAEIFFTYFIFCKFCRIATAQSKLLKQLINNYLQHRFRLFVQDHFGHSRLLAEQLRVGFNRAIDRVDLQFRQNEQNVFVLIQL